MTYARETLALSSMAPDLIPQDAPLEVWNSARNVLFRNGESVAARKDLQTGWTAQEVRTCVYVEPFDSGYWVYANASGIWAHDGEAEHDITPTDWTGHDAGATWTSCVINGLACVNSSARAPVYWDGNPSNVCQPLPDWPAGGLCNALRAHKNALFAIGFISEGGQRVRWSDVAEAGTIPQHWTPAADNLAGFVDLAPLSSDCLEGLALRDDFMVYKRESIWAFTFIGGNDVYAVRKVFAERGICATNAVCRGPNDEHLFCASDGDIYLSDGVSVQSVLDGRAQRTFYRQFSNPSGGVFSAVTLMREKIGVIIFPADDATEGVAALVMDWPSGAIAFREMPNVLCAAEGRMLNNADEKNSWDSQTETWDEIGRTWNTTINSASVEDCLIGNAEGMHVLGGAEETYPTSLEKMGLAWGNPQRRKLAVRIWPKVEGRAGDEIKFRFGASEQQGAPITLTQMQTYTVGQVAPLDVFASGRYISLHVSSKDTAMWRLGSIDIEYRELGGW